MATKGRTKGNKICPAGIAWTNIRRPMQIWLRASIVKTLITQKKAKDNGPKKIKRNSFST